VAYDYKLSQKKSNFCGGMAAQLIMLIYGGSVPFPIRLVHYQQAKSLF